MGYEKLGLQQLRELCDAFGLATDGKKAELVARIESKAVAKHVADAGAAATAAAAADPVEGSRAPAAAPRAQCPVKREAEAFLQTLGIDGVYFKLAIKTGATAVSAIRRAFPTQFPTKAPQSTWCRAGGFASAWRTHGCMTPS
jgi:hypothetical protein